MAPPFDRRGGHWLPYLRLFRAPNVFTAIADVAMGYFVTVPLGPLPQGVQWVQLALLASATSLMYTSGMVLNDVFDYEVDLRERPERPLPSGQIDRRRAKWLGWQMLLLGLALAWLAGLTAQSPAPWWRPGAAAALLAACIVLYDGGLKHTLVGPLAMGACRFLNVLMGMSLHATRRADAYGLAGWEPRQLAIAAGIGIYIVGVTLFARSEATRSPRAGLLGGMFVMTIGLSILAGFPANDPASFPYRLPPATVWPLTITVLAIWILRRGALAVFQPDPRRVQLAVKLSLMSLILFDAALCLLMCPPGYSLAILALLVPSTVLGRWVYST